MSNKTITLIKGDHKTYRVTVKDKNGTVVPLTGAEIIFTAREYAESETIIIQLKNTAASGSSDEIEDSDPDNGQFKIHFVPVNTEDLTKDQYVYDIQITLAGKVYTVVRSYLKIMSDVT